MWAIQFDGDVYWMKVPAAADYLALRKEVPSFRNADFLVRYQPNGRFSSFMSSRTLEYGLPVGYPEKNGQVCFRMSENGEDVRSVRNWALQTFRPCLIPLDKTARYPIVEQFARENPDGTHLEGGSVLVDDRLWDGRLAKLGQNETIEFCDSEPPYLLKWTVFRGLLYLEQDIAQIQPANIVNYADIFESVERGEALYR